MLKLFVSNIVEYIQFNHQILLLHTGGLRLNCIHAGLHDFLLVVVKLNTLLDDTTDPVDVVRDFRVPASAPTIVLQSFVKY